MKPDLLHINDLHVTFHTPTGSVRAVRGISLAVKEGEILGVVGESGCGKSVSFRAMLGLTPRSAAVKGEISFDGSPVSTDGELCEHVALIYQNPGAAINPVFTIGQQLGLVAGTKDKKVLAGFLEKVGLPDPVGSLDAYSHEFSGGMRQRAMIALALASRPRILFADEPTTALDVTTQAQVLDLLRELRDDSGLTIVLISHDLAVIRQLCDRIAVLYAGQLVEIGGIDQVLDHPTHPYTRALLDSTPRQSKVGQDLSSIPGSVPDGREPIPGCGFAVRCSLIHEGCDTSAQSLRDVEDGHEAACQLIGGAS